MFDQLSLNCSSSENLLHVGVYEKLVIQQDNWTAFSMGFVSLWNLR